MKARVVVLDYGSGNIRSVQRALERAGAEVDVSPAVATARDAAALVVPGVGAFDACIRALDAGGATDVMRERAVAGRPMLGICVGHQVLFASGDEHGRSVDGVGIWPEPVERLDAARLPHIGWNEVLPATGMRMFRGIEDARFYFVHSFAARARASGSGRLDAVTTHERSSFVAGREDDAVWGVQFHPEKSGEAGIALLANWLGSVS